MNVIITGTTGMVGEGVLFECLENPAVTAVLSISRKSYAMSHPKYQELLIPDFTQLDAFADEIRGYDACFFCAGVSSVGMKEDQYTRITYDLTLAFAKSYVRINPDSVFCYVSGQGTDSSEKSRLMWARVKGRTEHALSRLPFRSVLNFRPGVMTPFPGQKNWRRSYRVIANIMHFFAPKSVLTMQQVGRAMINGVKNHTQTGVLEIRDIRRLASER